MKETNLTIYQGSTFRLTINVEETDLTGFDVRSHIRKKLTDETYLIESTLDNGRFSIVNNSIQWEISAKDTASLPSGACVYDVELEGPDGYVVRILKGTIMVDPEVTR